MVCRRSTRVHADLPDPTRLCRATPADVPKMSQARRNGGSQRARRGHPPDRTHPEQPWRAGGITQSRRRACIWSRDRARRGFPGEGGDPRIELHARELASPVLPAQVSVWAKGCAGHWCRVPPRPRAHSKEWHARLASLPSLGRGGSVPHAQPTHVHVRASALQPGKAARRLPLQPESV